MMNTNYRERPEFDRYKYTPTSGYEDTRDWGYSSASDGTTGIDVGDSLNENFTLITLRKDKHAITTRFPAAEIPHLVHALLESAGLKEEAETVMRLALVRQRAAEERQKTEEERARKEKAFQLSKRRNKVLNSLRGDTLGLVPSYEEFKPGATLRRAVDRIIELEDKDN